MTFARIALALNALIFAVLGGWLLVQPTRLQEWIGLDVSTPAARVEFRAFYGGLELGLAAFLVWSLLDPRRHLAGCAAVALVLGATAIGRGVGLALERSMDGKLLAYLAVELLMALSGVVGWMLLRRAAAS